MDEFDPPQPPEGEPSGTEDERNPELNAFLSLLAQQRQQEQAEVAERARRSQEEDARFRQERRLAMSASEREERRFWLLCRSLLIALACAGAYWLSVHR